MTQPITNESGWRGSRDVWLSAAYESLLSSGVDAVRIMPLAKKLKLSRTSFYWFFSDRQAVLDALVELWRNKNTGNSHQADEGLRRQHGGSDPERLRLLA